MTAGGAFTVRTCTWAAGERWLRAVRRAVFVVEQGIPDVLEWDDADPVSLHAVALADGEAVGCARLLPDGHVGRVAVLAAWRRRGAGSALLRRLIDEARARGDARVVLNSQVDAMPFYARHGFVARGDEFLEAGIAHRVMDRAL